MFRAGLCSARTLYYTGGGTEYGIEAPGGAPYRMYSTIRCQCQARHRAGRYCTVLGRVGNSTWAPAPGGAIGPLECGACDRGLEGLGGTEFPPLPAS